MCSRRRAEDLCDLGLAEGRASASDDTPCCELTDDRPLGQALARELVHAGDDVLLAVVGLGVDTVAREAIAVGQVADALAARLLVGEHAANARAKRHAMVGASEV